MKFSRMTVFGLACLGLAGCKFDETDTKWQYMPDMADAPTVKSQESYIDPPEGSVSLLSVLYAETAAESEKIITNPLDQIVADPSRASQADRHYARGSENFARFCSPCHGDGGKGDGTVSKYFGAVPDLTTEIYANKRDGHFFHYITFGGAVMPGYGYAISIEERFEIILHLRKLQKAEK